MAMGKHDSRIFAEGARWNMRKRYSEAKFTYTNWMVTEDPLVETEVKFWLFCLISLIMALAGV